MNLADANLTLLAALLLMLTTGACSNDAPQVTVLEPETTVKLHVGPVNRTVRIYTVAPGVRCAVYRGGMEESDSLTCWPDSPQVEVAP